MRDSSAWARKYKALTAWLWIGGGLIALGGAILQYDPSSYKGRLPEVADFHLGVQAALPLTLIFVSVSMALAQIPRQIYGSPWVWKAVHDILNDFRDEVYGEDVARHTHRVTLFKKRTYCLGAQLRWRFWQRGWLVPTVRSGHTTQRTRTVFRAPDRPDEHEGVAGLTWCQWQVIAISHLPMVSNSNAPENDITLYATSTGISSDWVKRRRPASRSFAGIPIEVGGNAWGVVVLDSQNPTALSKDAREQYIVLGKLLGRILVRL